VVVEQLETDLVQQHLALVALEYLLFLTLEHSAEQEVL
jgi:hypothetical protein